MFFLWANGRNRRQNTSMGYLKLNSRDGLDGLENRTTQLRVERVTQQHDNLRVCYRAARCTPASFECQDSHTSSFLFVPRSGASL